MHTAYVSVRLGLLALLDDADMYGYQLKTAFEARTGGVWPLNIGQVYTTLGRLERDGLVAGSDRDGGDDDRQRMYSITAQGRSALADWFAESPADGPPPRDELIAKVLLALAGGTDRALDVVTAQRTALFAALQARRRALRAATLAVSAGAPDDRAGHGGDNDDAGGGDAHGGNGGATASADAGAAPSADAGAVPSADVRAATASADALAGAMVQDALVVRAEAELRWLDQCEARLLSRRRAGATTRRST